MASQIEQNVWCILVDYFSRILVAYAINGLPFAKVRLKERGNFILFWLRCIGDQFKFVFIKVKENDILDSDIRGICLDVLEYLVKYSFVAFLVCDWRYEREANLNG